MTLDRQGVKAALTGVGTAILISVLAFTLGIALVPVMDKFLLPATKVFYGTAGVAYVIVVSSILILLFAWQVLRYLGTGSSRVPLSHEVDDDDASSQPEGPDLMTQLRATFDALQSESELAAITGSKMVSKEHLAVLTAIANNSQRTISRLELVTPDLWRRANINLVIGLVTTVVATAVLAFAVLSQAPSTAVPSSHATDKPLTAAEVKTLAQTSHVTSAQDYLVAFAPRLSLAILMELCAYFFLRMYKSNLDEIRFIRNEITNVEQRRTALMTCVLSSDSQSVASITTAMAQSDRNAPSLQPGAEGSKPKDMEATIALVRDVLGLVTKSRKAEK